MCSRAAFLLPLLALTAIAQSSPNCPTHPTTVAAMRSCYRPLLVFAPTAQDPRLIQQQSILDHDADDMMDRNILLVPIPQQPAAKPRLPLDAPYALLPPSELAATRSRFHIAPGAFAVILLGEDGSQKLRTAAPFPTDKLNALIDTMPARRREMQQPHTN